MTTIKPKQPISLQSQTLGEIKPIVGKYAGKSVIEIKNIKECIQDYQKLVKTVKTLAVQELTSEQDQATALECLRVVRNLHTALQAKNVVEYKAPFFGRIGAFIATWLEKGWKIARTSTYIQVATVDVVSDKKIRAKYQSIFKSCLQDQGYNEDFQSCLSGERSISQIRETLSKTAQNAQDIQLTTSLESKLEEFSVDDPQNAYNLIKEYRLDQGRKELVFLANTASKYLIKYPAVHVFDSTGKDN